MNDVIAREYHADWPDKVGPGQGLVVIFVESADQRLILLADTPWNRGASMTNAIEAVIGRVVEEMLAPRGLDWRSANFVELDSMGCFDVPHTAGPPGYMVSWRPLVAVDDAKQEHRRTERAFLAGFGDAAESALACLKSIARERAGSG